jgi:hypothetical protein
MNTKAKFFYSRSRVSLFLNVHTAGASELMQKGMNCKGLHGINGILMR